MVPFFILGLVRFGEPDRLAMPGLPGVDPLGGNHDSPFYRDTQRRPAIVRFRDGRLCPDRRLHSRALGIEARDCGTCLDGARRDSLCKMQGSLRVVIAGIVSPRAPNSIYAL